MIELYALHWSHFVEKVRWALDFKQLEWNAVEVDPFTKKEMRHLDVKRITNNGYKIYSFPTLFDPQTNIALSDSTPIIEYLEDTYPDAPRLLPVDHKLRAEVKHWMLKLDSELGPDARRVGYRQWIVEIPHLVPKSFSPHLREGSFASWLVQVFVSGILIQRFRMHKDKEDRTFESLLSLLLPISETLAHSPYLVGESFTAADLTLASLLRPLRVVPFFRDHPALKPLFDWQTRTFSEHEREPAFLYENTMLARRLNKGYSLGKVSWLRDDFKPGSSQDTEYEVAVNDQIRTGRMQLLLAPWFYFRVRYLSGLKKLPTPPTPETTASNH